MRGICTRARSRVLFAIGASCLAIATGGCTSTPEEGNDAPGAAPVAADQPAAAGSDAGSGAATGAAPRAQGDAASRLAEDMSKEEAVRRKDARYLLEQGNKAYAEGEYSRAETLYQRALAADPSLDEAREKLILTMMFLGKRDGEIRSVIQEFGDAAKVATQERLTEARRLIGDGERALEGGDLELALRSLSRAREIFLWYQFEGIDTQADEEKANALFDRANDARRLAERDTARRQAQDASQEAAREREEATKRRAERIARLMQKVHEHMAAKEYTEASDICAAVLELEPGHKQAKRIRNEARDLALALRKAQYIDVDEDESRRVAEDVAAAAIPYDNPFTFHEDEEWWKTVVRRREEQVQTASLDETFEVQNIRRILNTQKADFNFVNQPLTTVVAYLRDIADINITIDPDIDLSDTANTVNVKLTNVPLQQALDLILKNTGLAYTFFENTLHVTTKEKAHGNTIFDIYNVTDILNKIRDFPGPSIRVRSNDESDTGGGASPFAFGSEEEEEVGPPSSEDLVDLIKKSTGGDELWTESQSEIQGHRGQLLITATRELHLAVQSFLQNLRKDSDLFVIVEARFIDMTDDFLEDIGVDTRNLGQPPGTGFGTAYGIMNFNNTGGSDQGINNLGNPTNPSLLMGQDRVASRIQHILDGFVGAASGERLDAALRGLTLQVTWLDPFQINAILRASQESRVARTLTAPRITASNGQRVHVSVITQRAYVQDYELVSGGTGNIVQEVADPVVSTFQEGVILDVQPVISSDRKYVTLDVRPTLASLLNGVISTVTVSLGSLQQAATLVDIDLPEITLQQAFTSVTVPDGGTVLLGGFRALNELKYESYIPIVGQVPILKNAFRRKAYINEKRSLYILLTSRVVDLRSEERRLYN